MHRRSPQPEVQELRIPTGVGSMLELHPVFNMSLVTPCRWGYVLRIPHALDEVEDINVINLRWEGRSCHPRRDLGPECWERPVVSQCPIEVSLGLRESNAVQIRVR